MVQDAKLVAMNINNNNAVSHWRESNRAVRISYDDIFYKYPA